MPSPKSYIVMGLIKKHNVSEDQKDSISQQLQPTILKLITKYLASRLNLKYYPVARILILEREAVMCFLFLFYSQNGRLFKLSI
ncbi:MAG: hypothetical protein ACI81S_001878 [Sphingobacteriales bacterium]|jgi:hypothetical protein